MYKNPLHVNNSRKNNGGNMKKNLKSLTVIFIVLALIGVTYIYSVSVQKSISQKVIRLHVTANSDTKEDQELKLYVRDEILRLMDKEIKGAENKEEALIIMVSKLPDIERIAKDAVKKSGHDYPVNANIVQENFPMKNYGAFTFPAGNYTALKVSIGEAKGKNWWCVIFPPLCLTEETISKDGFDHLEDTFSATDMEIVNCRNEGPERKVKFFIVEKWQELLS